MNYVPESLRRISQVLSEQQDTMEQVNSVVRQAFRSGRTKKAEWRIGQLEAIVRMVREREAEFLEALFKDLGKPAHEAYVDELASVKNSALLCARKVNKWMKPTKVAASVITFPSSAAIVPEPLGVVLVISTWNFPLLLSIDPVIGAISGGNAVVLKPSQMAPATSAVMAKLLPMYMDKEAIQVVEGSVPETTALLEQEWDKIIYTGSPRVGKIVMAAAAKNLTPVLLELGGKCPVLIDSTVNLKVAAKRIAFGKWCVNDGQACIAPDYVLAEKSAVPDLVKVLTKCIGKFFGEDPAQSKDLARIVNGLHYKRLVGLMDEVHTNIVHGGQRDETKLYISPTIILDPPKESAIMSEEIFGPLLPIIPVDTMDVAIDFVNSKPKPLALYLFTNKKALEKKVVRNTSSGGMVVNDTVFHFTTETLPFGGVGQSGMGAYHGKFSFDAFSHQKAVLYRSFKADSRTKYPPFTTKKQLVLRCLLDGNYLGLVRALLFS